MPPSPGEPLGRPFGIAVESCARSSSPSATCSTRCRRRAAFSTAGVEAPSAAQHRPRSRPAHRRASATPSSAHGPLRRAQLQPGRAGAARHGQEPSLPAGLALRAPDLGRQGDGRQDVRQQRQRPARPGLPVRRRLLRRGVGRVLRPEGRRQHHEGLHGVRRVQPGQGEHPRRRQHRAWSATSTWTSSTSSASATCSARCRRRCATTPRSWTASTPICPAGTSRKSSNDLFTDHFGLVSDFLSECWSQLRNQSRVDGDAGPRHARRRALRPRHQRRHKTVSGLLKLLYPDPDMPVPTRTWSGRALALECRRRVKEQQKRIGAPSSATRTSATPWARRRGEVRLHARTHRARTASAPTRSRTGPGLGISPGGQDEGAGLYRIEVTSGPGAGVKILNRPRRPPSGEREATPSRTSTHAHANSSATATRASTSSPCSLRAFDAAKVGWSARRGRGGRAVQRPVEAQRRAAAWLSSVA
jgi:hypothetical protein